MSKLLSLAAFIVLVSQSLTAQQFATSAVALVSNDEPIAMNGWQVYHETPEFRIEYNRVDCDPSVGVDFEAIHFRFINLTSNDITLNWHIDLYYNDDCKTCGGDSEYSRNLVIPANQTVETDCESGVNAGYRLFSKYNDPVYDRGDLLTSFQLSNLTMTSN